MCLWLRFDRHNVASATICDLIAADGMVCTFLKQKELRISRSSQLTLVRWASHSLE